MKKYIIKLFVGLALISLSNCVMYKDPPATQDLAEESLPTDFEIPTEWTAVKKDTTDVKEDWYKVFNDTILNSLINEALDTVNPSIRYQLANIDIKSANVDIAKAGRSLFIDYNVAYTGSTVVNGDSQYNVGLYAPIRWEADLWGRIKAGVLAANEAVIAQIKNYSYTRQSIAGNICNLYFDISTTKKAIKVGNDYIKLNHNLVEILKVKQDVGISDIKDVYLAEAQYNSIKSIIEELKNSLQIQTRELEAILGRYPEGNLDINWLSNDLIPIKSISDPISLIRRRPDILMNESQVRSAFYMTEQAKLAKYPNLVLTATPGISSASTLVLGTGASLLGPILNGGLIEANIRKATATQKASVSLYGLSIINALKEVESSMDSEYILFERRKYTEKYVEESRNAYDVVVTQFEEGKIDIINTLYLQSRLLVAEFDLIKNTQDIYKQRVKLYLALGGDITEY
ncbi:MAG: TolC family protein [Bacteroidota bacterium]